MEPENNGKKRDPENFPDSPVVLQEPLEKEVCWAEAFTLSGGCCGG